MTTATTNPITLPVPTTADEAIAFAVDHLEPFELPSFLRAWREGEDIKPMVKELEAILREGEEIACEQAAKAQ